MIDTFQDRRKRDRSLGQALVNLRPGAEWTLVDSFDVKTLVWHDRSQSRPSDEQILAEQKRILDEGA